MLSQTLSGATSFPGLVLKAWAQVSSAGTLIKGFNVTSITKGGAGIYTLNFTGSMASTNYIAKLQHATGASVYSNGIWAANSQLVGSMNYTTYNSVATANNTPHFIEVWE
jgi:hypothetical protein